MLWERWLGPQMALYPLRARPSVPSIAEPAADVPLTLATAQSIDIDSPLVQDHSHKREARAKPPPQRATASSSASLPPPLYGRALRRDLRAKLIQAELSLEQYNTFSAADIIRYSRNESSTRYYSSRYDCCRSERAA